MDKNLHCINSATFSSTTEVTLCKGHMFNKHEVDKHISCPHCDFHGARKGNIHVHIDGHHAELYEKQFDCHHCSRWSTCVLVYLSWFLTVGKTVTKKKFWILDVVVLANSLDFK